MNIRSIAVETPAPTRESGAAFDLAGPVTDLVARTAVVAAIAAASADAVDRESRFPREAMSAARSQRLLGIMVPHDLGGEGASISDVVDVCYGLGRACASTAMIYAMHQTKVACLVRHGRDSAMARARAAAAGRRAIAAGVLDHRRAGRRRRPQERRADRVVRRRASPSIETRPSSPTGSTRTASSPPRGALPRLPPRIRCWRCF